MIHIEDVTDADAAPQKHEAANPAPAVDEAKASEQITSPAVQSPETDANIEGSEEEVSESSEEDVQVSADAALKGQCHDGLTTATSHRNLLLKPKSAKTAAMLCTNRESISRQQ